MQTACMTQQQPIRSEYMHEFPNYDENWYSADWDKNFNMADPPVGIIVGAIVALVATVVVCRLINPPKRPILLTKARDVLLYMHQEAPAEADFISDVEVRGQMDATAVKITLRNQAASLGGNLLVIDAINSESETLGDISFIKYSGCGRVYRLKTPIPPPTIK